MAEYIYEVVTEHELCGDVHHYVRRERIVRCGDCAKSELRGRRLYCKAPMGHVGYAEVCEDDFCSCGEPREAGE